MAVAKSSILDFNGNGFDLSVSIKLVTKQKTKRNPKSKVFHNSEETASESVSPCASDLAQGLTRSTNHEVLHVLTESTGVAKI